MFGKCALCGNEVHAVVATVGDLAEVLGYLCLAGCGAGYDLTGTKIEMELAA